MVPGKVTGKEICSPHLGFEQSSLYLSRLLNLNVPQVIEKYVQNPENRMGILSKATSEGYFQSQGIQTVKVVDQVQGQKPVSKYFPINNNLKQSNNAGNSSTKTK